MSHSDYIELHGRSAFSFLRGASLPEELAKQAANYRFSRFALCDRMGVYGAPRFFGTARECGLRPIIGVELEMEDGCVLPVLVESRTGYRNLCRLLTKAHLRAAKGEAVVQWAELPEFTEGLVALTGDEGGPLIRAITFNDSVPPEERARRLVQIFGHKNVFIEIQRHLRRGEERVNRCLIDLARTHDLPLLATNGVLYATPPGRQVLDMFTCLRHHTHLDAAGTLLSVNAERHLKSPAQMTALFADLPGAISNSARLADRLEFTLENLGYEFPKFPVAAGETMDGVLHRQAYAGARNRYAGEIPEKVRRLLEKELALVQKLGFAGYFLIVADIVRYCRENNIMAQGRGSAANSALCFCLGITAVDVLKYDVLFERFLTENRKSWPDIDIDLPSGDRREQVIQEVYRRYGPQGAAMTATVISYRGRSAAREIGKALNLPADVLDRFSNLFANGDFPHTLELLDQAERSGLPRTHPRAAAFASLYQQVRDLPRHLGQHSGGMIICQGQLDSIVPLENASMPGRVVAQWDKDDCEDLGIIKVDLLGLGMMSALQDAVTLTRERGHPVDLANLPQNDRKTFELIRRAETIGLFQIESRAQMATLPRMQPENFYDLCIEVAIVRPGPLQGDLAHPYLRRRIGQEAVTYFDDRLESVLKRTLGVPLFQEQMLQMAMIMGDLSGDEAEDLRRALSYHRSEDRMNKAVAKLRAGMERKGVAPEVAERIVRTVGSFALYGFPESHAISFALLAYASAYLKVHRAPEFFTALLNNQPMGFYSAATLIKDAKRNGVQASHVCVARSSWDCLIEADHSIRLGLRQVQGLRRDEAISMLEERQRQPFVSLADFKLRTRFSKDELRTLAEIGALNCFEPHRRAALWKVEQTVREDDLWSSFAMPGKVEIPLHPMNEQERLHADYAGLRLTTGPHPMALIRQQLSGILRATDLPGLRDGQAVRIAGQVICRQRPGTAKGICFISLEDETGICNAIVSPQLFERERLKITAEQFLIIHGVLQNRHKTIHIQARAIERLDYPALQTAASHDFS